MSRHATSSGSCGRFGVGAGCAVQPARTTTARGASLMAKTKKTTGAKPKKAKGKTVHSTAKGAESRKGKSDKPAGLGGTARDCCTPAMTALADLLASAPSGALLTVEDGFP